MSNQFETYYKHGTYADCPVLLRRWQNCLRSRLKKPEEGEALMNAEREASVPGTHIFHFRPEYAREAKLRYGVDVMSSGVVQTDT